MGKESLQDSYAKNLPTEFGYPLRIPQPSSNLPETYQENGLQIGDVGYVDPHGAFHVLFNVRYSSDHVLHRKRRPPAGFEPIQVDDDEVTVNPRSISSGQFIGSPEIRHRPLEQPDERLLYRFVPSSSSGAILILPFGAVQQEINKHTMERFREVAVEHARTWWAEAMHDSVYLITGFHKARSWSLGSFRNAPHDAEILVKQPRVHDENAGIHEWAPNFSMYWLAGPAVTETGSLNQTVFITGFKVTVRSWLCVPDVELLQQPSSALFAFFRLFVIFLQYIISTVWQCIVLKRHEHVPQLSPPFHPSDVINRCLLDKNPRAQVAITHDRQWMSVLKQEKLIHGDIMNEGDVWEILRDEYISTSADDAVWLESKNGVADKSSGVTSTLSSLSNNDTLVATTGDTSKLCPKYDGFSLRQPLLDNPWIVISRIRADNVVVGLRRRPVGFYILLEFNGIRRRTRVKSILVRENVIEWDDEIILSNDVSKRARLSFCAAFEFEPMLSDGPALWMADITVGDLVDSTTLINFSSGAREGCSSLLITTERRYSPYLEVHSVYEHEKLRPEEPSAVLHETDMGRQALLRYYEHYSEEDLKNAIDHFHCALHLCHPDDECLPAALFNLAMVKLHEFEVSNAGMSIAESITLYREALEMRGAPHSDRPATLLGLGQALLYRCGREEPDESLADDLEKLMNEVMLTCPEGSHEHRAAVLLLQTYKRIGVLNHGTLSELDELVPELAKAVRVLPEYYFDQPNRLENLGAVLRRRFEKQGYRGQLADLDEAIVNLDAALQHTPDNHPDRASRLSILGRSLRYRFDELGDTKDIKRAITIQEEAVKLTPKGHPHHGERLQELGVSLGTRFIKLGDVEYIERAIEIQEEAIQLTAGDNPCRAERLRILGVSLKNRFTELGDIEYLERAIASQEEALKLTPVHHLHRAQHLHSLGVFLRTRFQEYGLIQDIERAIVLQEEAVKLAPEDHPRHPEHLQELGISLRARFVELGTIEDLERAIATQEEAVRLTPEDHPRLAEYLQEIGVSLAIRFDTLGDTPDLQQAIAIQEKAVTLSPENHPRYAECLQELGISLRTRFDKLGEIKDLERAVAIQERAVKLFPADHPRCAECLHELGVSLGTFYIKFGDVKDLARAILAQEEAVKLTPEDHPHYTRRLEALGIALRARSSILGDVEDLEQAVAAQTEVIQLTPNDHPHLVEGLQILAVYHRDRFIKFGDIEDLDQAIAMMEEAVQLTQEDHPCRAQRLYNLGLSVGHRFDEFGDIEDLERVTIIQKELVELTPEDHPHRTGRLRDLGISLGTCFDKLGDIDDLEEAIGIQEELVEPTQEDYPDRAQHLYNLGVSLRARFHRLNDNADIERAIFIEEEAVRHTPKDHPHRAQRLQNLGTSLLIRYDVSRQAGGLVTAIPVQQEITSDNDFDPPEGIEGILPTIIRLGSQSPLPNMLIDSKDGERAFPMEQGPQAVPLTPEYDPPTICRMNVPLQVGNIEVLKRAIMMQEEAVQLTQEDHPCYARRLGVLNELVSLLDSESQRPPRNTDGFTFP